MLNFNYLPIHFSIFLILGILVGHTIDFSMNLLLAVIIASLLLLIYLKFRAELSYDPPLLFAIITAFLFINVGVIRMMSKLPRHQKRHYINFINSENRAVLKIRKLLKPNGAYNKYEANVIELNGQNVLGDVILSIKRDSFDIVLNIDELLYTSNQFKEIQGTKNPYEFDYKQYLIHQNIYHQLSLEKGDFIALGSGEVSLKGIAYSLRTRINRELVNYNFSSNELSILNALLLGQRRGISKEQFKQYRDAGAIHILAVSGLHIGIILIILNFLFQHLEKLKNGKLIKLIVIIVCLWSYAFVAGLSASIIRSVTMFTAIAVGMISNRPSEVRNSLIISLFFLLLLNPFYLFDVGFQLSFLAVFSIVWLQPIFSGIWKPKPKPLRYFWNLLTVTFAAQLGILPLTLFYFHQFPILFFVSSLVIIPFLGIILGLGFLIIILALTHLLHQFIADLYEWILTAMNDFVALISYQEELILKNISFSILILISSYILMICIVTLLKTKSIRNFNFFLISILFLQMNLIFEKIKVQNSNQFIVFHQSKNTILGNRLGNILVVYENEKSTHKNPYSPLFSFKNSLPNLKIRRGSRIKNGLKVDAKNVMIIDSSGTYSCYYFNPDIVILIGSPRINMDRMIEILNPKMVIADGSNYLSFALKWGKSCKEKSVQFYNTSEDGAFVYNYSP